MDIVVSDEAGNAVVAVGQWQEGRYAANGMCTGLGPGDVEIGPEGVERQVLVNVVKWLGQR